MNEELRSRLRRYQWQALAIGLVLLVASGAGGWFNPRQFFFSYLFSLLFWLGLSLGAFGITMIHELTGGRWGYPTRRFLEAAFMGLPAMLALFVPVFLGLRFLYPWADPAKGVADPVLQAQSGYENRWGYIARQILFLALWIWMAARLRRWSLEQDATSDAGPTRKARALSGPGLVLFGLVGTFASIDWIMSLEKGWYSTLFGVIVLIGDILTAYAFAIIALTLFRKQPPIAEVVERTHYHHLGNLLLTFVLFWTYISFGQLLIIYSGDLPRELDWYRHRIAGQWKTVVATLALFHFFVPFFLLLFRTVKWHTTWLALLAGMVFVMRAVDSYWLVMPALHSQGVALHWLDLTLPLALGGLWVGFFLARLRAAPLLPQKDPGMQFAFVYEHL